MIKICPVCYRKFKAKPSGAKTCSISCGQKLRRQKDLKIRKQRYIKNLEFMHPDIKYISGYKSRHHRDIKRFKILVQCKKTGIRFYAYDCRLRIKNWKCSVCNFNNYDFIDIYSADIKQYRNWQFVNRKIKPITFYPHKCKWCGKWFASIRLSNNAYCSEKCRKKHKNFERRKRNERRLRQAKANGQFENVTLPKLYKRDHGICYLCGKHLVLNNNYNRPDAPTIEHIIPICKGGTNTWDNVKLACRHCNVAKGIKLVKEYLNKAS